MNKIFFLMIALFISSVSAFADDRPYGMAGCGFGSVVVGKNAGGQVAAGTSNWISTQSFSISSGTSNCVTSEQRVAKIHSFIEFNYISLNGEATQGRGDSMNALASLYGCNSVAFAQKIQENYTAIFQSSSVDATQVLVQINKVIKDNPELKASCAFGA